ncbi:hypothetical protein K466DRAFT_12382 [Polyporus arcularius HHB13444]|uniref:Uncharacterized protein n=1 Tax=Polyporus arcularius HHB13444 TaxID=1314778 RepID=A0A5C3P1H0_9APHY|nr:hypothetical protein K466DRAFT_12382 [Polyporus arcularius HHB13444]
MRHGPSERTLLPPGHLACNWIARSDGTVSTRTSYESFRNATGTVCMHDGAAISAGRGSAGSADIGSSRPLPSPFLGISASYTLEDDSPPGTDAYVTTSIPSLQVPSSRHCPTDSRPARRSMSVSDGWGLWGSTPLSEYLRIDWSLLGSPRTHTDTTYTYHPPVSMHTVLTSCRRANADRSHDPAAECRRPRRHRATWAMATIEPSSLAGRKHVIQTLSLSHAGLTLCSGQCSFRYVGGVPFLSHSNALTSRRGCPCRSRPGRLPLSS